MNTLAEWLSALQCSEKTILVEGKNDAHALRELGVIRVIVLKGRPLFETIESLEVAEFIILTDLDAAGKALYKEVKGLLVKHGKKVDTVFREFLLRETKLSHIEGLPAYLRNNL